MLKTAVVLIVALAAQVAAPAGLSVGKPAPPFVLSDQFDRVWRLSNLRGRVVVLIAINQHSTQGSRLDPES